VSGRFEGFLQLVAIDATFSDYAIIEKQHRDPPVVQREQMGVGVDVGELWLEAQVTEEAEGVITEVTVIAGD
jgi:hypothetical protein